MILPILITIIIGLSIGLIVMITMMMKPKDGEIEEIALQTITADDVSVDESPEEPRPVEAPLPLDFSASVPTFGATSTTLRLGQEVAKEATGDISSPTVPTPVDKLRPNPLGRPIPAHWGEKPTAQTKDIKTFPPEFGGIGGPMGSSTMYSWISKNLQMDKANGIDSINPGLTNPGVDDATPIKKQKWKWTPPRVRRMDGTYSGDPRAGSGGRPERSDEDLAKHEKIMKDLNEKMATEIPVKIPRNPGMVKLASERSKSEKKNFHLMTIKESTIPGAGSGAFAKQFIPANTDLGRYYGRTSSSTPKDGSYAWRIDGKYIDANFGCDEMGLSVKQRTTRVPWCVDNPLKYVNAPKNENEKHLVNTIMETKEDEHGNVLPHYYTTRDIDVGEELFVDYGDEYWPDMTDETPVTTPTPVKSIAVPPIVGVINGTPAKSAVLDGCGRSSFDPMYGLSCGSIGSIELSDESAAAIQ